MDSLPDGTSHLQQSWTAKAGPTLVVHTYLTVPIVSHALHNLYHWVRIRLNEPIGKWIVLLDPQEVDTLLWDCYTLPNCDVHVIPGHYYNVYACEKINWYIEQCPLPGTIVLIAKGGDFTPLWKHRINGWKIVIVHPPGLSWALQQMAQERLVLPVTLGPPGHEELNDVLKWSYQSSMSLTIVFTKPLVPLDKKGLSQLLGNCGQTYAAAVKPPVTIPTASGDAAPSSLDDFLHHTLPSTITERNLVGIFEEMQKLWKKIPIQPGAAAEGAIFLGEPIQPRIVELLLPVEDKKEGHKEGEEEQQLPKVKTMADVCKSAAAAVVRPAETTPKRSAPTLATVCHKQRGGRGGQKRAAKFGQRYHQMGRKNPEPQRNHSKMKRLVEEGSVLMSRFLIDGMIAGGGFGQVYLGTDNVTGMKCAVNVQGVQGGVESEKRIKLEMMLYARLRGQDHIPLLIAACPLPNEVGIAMEMQLVGRSLADVRRQMPAGRFSHGTLFRAMRQVLSAISVIHKVGFLHRDVKPPNCCLGAIDVGRIYLLDFDLCRQYIDCTGMVRKSRKEAPFRGTLRYASLAGHAKQEFGPCNDLVAFLYSTVELGNAGLPWSHVAEKDRIEKMKSDISNQQLCTNQPQLLAFTEEVMSMKYHTIPDYGVLMKLFDQFQQAGLATDTPYDWEINP